MKASCLTSSENNRRMRLPFYCLTQLFVNMCMRGVRCSSRALALAVHSVSTQTVSAITPSACVWKPKSWSGYSGRKYPRLSQVDSVAPFTHVPAEVHDCHHEGDLSIHSARTLNPRDARVFVDEVLLDDDVAILERGSFVCWRSCWGASYQQEMWSTVPREDVASRCVF